MNQAPELNPQVKVSVPHTDVDPTRRLEKQMCGYVFCMLIFTASVWEALTVVFKIFTDRSNDLVDIAKIIALSLGLYFYGSILFVPEYAAGNPGILKIWPLALDSIIMNFANYFDKRPAPVIMLNFSGKSHLIQKAGLIQSLGSSAIGLLILYCMFLLDDDGGSCCLCFKPWIYKRIPYAHGVYGQPPQGYPQVYPPQAQGHPQVYPPQAQGHPQVYPPQGQGHPPQTQVTGKP